MSAPRGATDLERVDPRRAGKRLAAARQRVDRLLGARARRRTDLGQRRRDRRDELGAQGGDVGYGRSGGQPRLDLTLAAQAVVDRPDQLAQRIDPIRRRNVERIRARLAAIAEPDRESALEGLGAQRAGVALVEDGERRVQPCRDRIGLQHPHAEAVDRRDPCGLGGLCEVATAERDEARADALAQLARGLLGERDRQDRGGIDAVVDARAHEPLGQHARLARARVRGDDQPLVAPCDRARLLGE